MRIGHGYDVHKLVEDRDLILGGVKIPYEKGFWVILMRMCCCMLCPMLCWELPDWEISASIFLTQIPSIRVRIP